MKIRCSVGNCDPCRESVTIPYNGINFFCYHAFKEKFHEDNEVFSEMPLCSDPDTIIQRETEDIVGECCGEVE